MPLIDSVKSFIDSGHLLEEGAHVIVGLSGGADSVALLSVLAECGYRCTAVHCNFHLRGDESERDATHARTIAATLRIPFVRCDFDTVEYMTQHKVSAEMACRELRYARFEEIRHNTGAEAIAVGHHMEDNFETLLLNMIRGCGIHGIRGMLPRNGRIVRPLLEVSKQQLLQYLAERKLGYVIDSSNQSNDFKRNKIRNIVTPALTQAFPDALDRISSTLRNLRGCEAIYNQSIAKPSHSLATVRNSASPETLLHEWLSPLGFNMTQCRDILHGQCGAQFTSSQGRLLTICRNDRIEISTVNTSPTEPSLSYKVIDRSEFSPAPGTLYLDIEAADGSPEFAVRTWKPGDRMTPFGMKHTRLVSDILNDCGINATQRANCHLLTRNGEILWIIGLRASAHFPVTQHTKQVICITNGEDNSHPGN